MQKQTIKKAVPLALGSAMMIMTMAPAASAFAATGNPYVTGLTVSANGDNVTAHAMTSGHYIVEYEFKAETSGGQWKIVRSYQPNASFTAPSWATHVQAFAMTKYELGTKQWNMKRGSAPVAVKSTANPINAVHEVTGGLTAKATSSVNGTHTVLYEFKVQKPGSSTWSIVGPYSTTSSFKETSTTAGTYAVKAFALTKSEYANHEWGKKVASGVHHITVSAGSPASVKLSAAHSSLTADGQATDTITATVVDKNGNPVTNYNGTITIQGQGTGTDSNHSYAPYVTTSAGAYLEGGSVNTSTSTETFNVTNGVAKVTVVAPPTVTSTSDTISAQWTGPNGNTHNANTTLTYATAQAAAFKLNPSSTLISSGGSVTVPIQVVDANGNPVTSGVYTVKATVSGSGYFPGNTQSEQFTFSGGSGSVTIDAPAYASSGSVNLNVSGSISGGATLNSASQSFTIGQPGTASKLTLNQPSNNQYLQNAKISADNTAHTVNLPGSVEDSNGFTTTTSAPSSVNYTITSGGSTVATGTASVGAHGNYSIPFGGSTSTYGTAGTYTVTVSANGLTSASQTVTVVPGAPVGIAVSPSVSSVVTASNPTRKVTAQLVDNEGNPVSESGKTVKFYLGSGAASGTTLNGATTYNSSSSPISVTTNGNGQAIVTLGLPSSGGIGDTAHVDAVYGSQTVQKSATVKEVGVAVTNVSVTAGQTSAYTAGSVAGSSTTPMFTIKPTDNYGDLANGDVVQVTLPQNLFGGGTNLASDFHGVASSAAPVSGTNDTVYTMTTNGSPITFYGATPQTVGNYTIKAQDLSAPSQPAGSASVSVTSGTVAGFALFDGSGTDLSASGNSDSVAAGSTLALTLKPVDSQGNPVSTDGSYTVTLPTASNVTWRTSAGGTDVGSVTFAPGQTQKTVYLVNNGSSSVNVGYGHAVNADYASGDLTAAPVADSFTASTNPSKLSASGYSNSSDTLTTQGGSTTFTVTLVDSSGNPVGNEPVYLHVPSGNGSLSASTVYTNSLGQATFTYTTPSGWNSGSSSVTFGVQVGGGAYGAISLPSQTQTVTVSY